MHQLTRYFPRWSLFLLVLAVAACVQTKTLVADADVNLVNIKQPLYCGTYSSFVYYDKNQVTRFNDSLTGLGNRLYDSIIRRRIKRLSFASQPLPHDTSEARALIVEFTQIIAHAEKSQSIRGFQAGAIFEKVTRESSNDQFLFFIPTGYQRSAANFKEVKKQQGNHLGPNAQMAVFMGSLLATAFTGNVVFYVFKANNSGPSAMGSNCHIILYTKSLNRVSLYRQQFFANKNVGPLERRYLTKQVEYLLKEYL